MNFNEDRKAKIEAWLLAQEQGTPPPPLNQHRRLNRKARGLAKCWTLAKRTRIIKRDGGKCLKCGESNWAELTLDHVDPRLPKEAINQDKNLQTLCRPCNEWKKDRVIDYRH